MKTSKKDFEYFKERCLFWQKELGLMNWEITFEHKPLKDKYAETSYGFQGAKSTITLNTTMPKGEVIQYRLESSALHEVLHLLFAPYFVKARDFYSFNYLDEIEHHMIQPIVNLLIKNA